MQMRNVIERNVDHLSRFVMHVAVFFFQKKRNKKCRKTKPWSDGVYEISLGLQNIKSTYLLNLSN